VRTAAISSAAAPSASEKAAKRKLEQQAEAAARPKSFRQQIRERRRPVSVIPAATPISTQVGVSTEPEHAQSLPAIAEAPIGAPPEDPIEVPTEPEHAQSLPAARPFAPAADGRVVGWTEVHSSGCRPTWASEKASYLSVYAPHVSAFHGRLGDYLFILNALV